jgi:thiamine-phosphate pyrophosphorylase
LIAPRVVQLTALDVVPRDELLRRLDRVASLEPASRRAFAVQLRDPQLQGRALLDWGRELRERTRAIGAALIVNDRLDLALLLDADGVHLGRRSVGVADARRLVGDRFVARSAHGLDEARAAAAEGANAVVLSPVFATPGKGTPLGLDAVAEARAALARPVALVALGGIDAGRGRACLAAGADGVAVIRADVTALLRL